jgi:superfamily II DNA or RNA helicase
LTHKLFRRPIGLPERTTPLDPYFMGVLLGDGSLSRGTPCVTKEDPEIVEVVRQQAQILGLEVRAGDSGGTRCTSWFLTTGVRGGNGSNRLIDILSELGLRGTDSFTKFVPDMYKRNSRDVRLHVLAGLLDTDGYMGNHYDFSSASLTLAHDVVYLARSVGLAAYGMAKIARCQTGAVGTYWRVSISGDLQIIPCRIPRKKAGPRLQIKSVLRTGFEITPEGTGDFYGFTLDRDGRYLMGDFTVTHNSGKTVVSADIIRSSHARGKRSIFIAHRKELIDQCVDKLTRFGVRAGVIMADDGRRDDWLPVQVCSIQTLARRMDRLPPADLIIVDEAHHALSESYKALLKAYDRAYVIGLTATPWRTDRLGLADLFSAHVVATSTRELIDQGALAPYDAFAYNCPDLHQVKMVAGDFEKKSLELACNTKIIVGSIVREYLDHAAGRRAIVFPTSIAHSKAIVDEFRAAGVSAAHVDCHMAGADRDAALCGLHVGNPLVVSSVGVLSEGFDVPSVEVIILARPTKSVSLYIQQVGRGLRTSPETGKSRALIHDHAGNLFRHGFICDLRDCSPLATPSRERDLHTCPLCHVVFASCRDGKCPGCGQAIQPVAAKLTDPRGREKEIIEGERVDMDTVRRLREKAEVMGIARALTDVQFWRAHRATREMKASEYLRLKDVAGRKGFQPGFVYHAFRETFGHAPSFDEDELVGVHPAAKPFFPLKRG